MFVDRNQASDAVTMDDVAVRPAPAFLRAVAREAENLALTSRHLQEVLSTGVFARLQLRTSDLKDCQSLDLITQTLDDLAKLIEGVASVMPETLHIGLDRALAPLKLDDLRRRLGNGAGPCLMQAGATPAGALDLFD